MMQNKPFFIGITGGVGAGKSEILKYIRTHYNCEIYLADEVAHLVKKKGTACFAELVELLGEDVVGEDGEIDKLRMAQKIFSDANLLEKVNGIIHPAVKVFLLEHLEEARQKDEVEIFFVEAALLIEGGYKELVDEMWYVFADVETRKSRLMQARGYSAEKVEQILASQLSEEDFRANSDFVIDNSGDYAESCRQIDEKLKEYTKVMKNDEIM